MERHSKTITAAVIDFITTTGEKGATLSEIYAAVRDDIGEKTLDTSIRAIVYQKLVGAKNRQHRQRFERLVENGKSRYRLIKMN